MANDTKVIFHLDDPHALTDTHQQRWELPAEIGQNLLEVALAHDINIEHACGGVCACSTCHVYIESGDEFLSEAEDDELDRVEEAPALQINSRLACQCVIEKPGIIEARVPGWNRNAVKEVPH